MYVRVQHWSVEPVTEAIIVHVQFLFSESVGQMLIPVLVGATSVWP